MQNYMPMTAVEFQYAERLFSATGSSNISAWIEVSGRNLARK